MRLRWLIAILVPYFIFAGCRTVSEGDRQLIQQDRQAGKLIKEKAKEPELQQAGHDVEKNSETLATNLGIPVTPVPEYSPKASDDFRKQSEDEHKQAGDFFTMVLGLVAAWVPGGAAVVAGVGWVRSVIRNVQANKALFAVARGVNALPRAMTSSISAPAERDAKHTEISDLIQEVLVSAAKSEGAHAYMDKLLSTWRSQGRIGKIGA